MKSISLLFAFAIILLSQSTVYAQKLPDVSLKNVAGEDVTSAIFDNDGKPMVIVFWATWCKPAILELNIISDEYADWQSETGVKVIAISIDDARNSAKVKPFVNGKEWDYEVYIDEPGVLKEALGFTNVPMTYVLDGNKKIVWELNSFVPGDEVDLYDAIKEVAR